MKVSFDTNVLFYCLDPNDAQRHAASVTLVRSAQQADVLLTLQALSETFNVARRRGKQRECLLFLAELRYSFQVVNADVACLDEAIELCEQHQFSFWDAMLVATVRRAGCEVLFTEDMQDGRSIGGLLLVNPFEERNAGLIDIALKRNG